MGGETAQGARHLLGGGVRVPLRPEDDADVRQVLRHEGGVGRGPSGIHVQGQAEGATRRQRKDERAVRSRSEMRQDVAGC